MDLHAFAVRNFSIRSGKTFLRLKFSVDWFILFRVVAVRGTTAELANA
jgi:hypothetical protein